MVEQARQEAERIIESAHAERGSLISDTEVARQSQDEADRILAEARREAEEIRAEADDYVDSKLANFEVVLTKTIGSVDRGREKLLGRGPGLDEQGYADEDAPERSADPETLRRRADDVRGHQARRLRGRPRQDPGGGRPRPAEAARPDRPRRPRRPYGRPGRRRTAASEHASDADYLAGLAELAAASPGSSCHVRPGSRPRMARQQIPAPEPSRRPPGYGYQQQDPYAARTATRATSSTPTRTQQQAGPQQDAPTHDPNYG